MKKEGFKNFNSLGNYFSKVGNWDQNKIQEIFVGMIRNCELTSEQISAIESHLIKNNECLGGKGMNTTSIKKFELIKDSLLKEQSVWIEETRKKVA